jgi:hypothetical protein
MTVIFCNIHKQQEMDSCDACEAENPKLWRCARVSVELTREVLTAHFEESDDAGWNYLEGEITKTLIAKIGIQGVKVSFEEWEAEPEVV